MFMNFKTFFLEKKFLDERTDVVKSKLGEA